MATDNIRWGPPPDRRLPHKIPIEAAPKDGSVLYFWSLSCDILGVFTHWWEGRSIPCIGRDQGCVCGVRNIWVATRWRGYLAAWHDEWERFFIAEVTDQAVRESKSVCDLAFEDLRGRKFALRRLGKNRNAKVQIELCSTKRLEYELPAAFDLREALARIWAGPSKGQ